MSLSLSMKLHILNSIKIKSKIFQYCIILYYIILYYIILYYIILYYIILYYIILYYIILYILYIILYLLNAEFGVTDKPQGFIRILRYYSVCVEKVPNFPQFLNILKSFCLCDKDI
jgi:hypothetical protein